MIRLLIFVVICAIIAEQNATAATAFFWGGVLGWMMRGMGE